ncbi:hypothetical protein OSTOST_12834, partial [Ostertagia ostertagi]
MANHPKKLCEGHNPGIQEEMLEKSKCLEECASMVSYCVGTSPLIVCQLNIIVFLTCILLAVFTGVAIPMTCLLCYVTSWCSDVKRTWRRLQASDEEIVNLNPRSVQ